jgi:hypothetical protein
VGAAVFRPSRKSNPALATDLEPVYVRTPPRFEAIQADRRLAASDREHIGFN